MEQSLVTGAESAHPTSEDGDWCACEERELLLDEVDGVSLERKSPPVGGDDVCVYGTEAVCTPFGVCVSPEGIEIGVNRPDSWSKRKMAPSMGRCRYGVEPSGVNPLG